MNIWKKVLYTIFYQKILYKNVNNDNSLLTQSQKITSLDNNLTNYDSL